MTRNKYPKVPHKLSPLKFIHTYLSLAKALQFLTSFLECELPLNEDTEQQAERLLRPPLPLPGSPSAPRLSR